MAVSNAIGSNVFDIDLGIGLPFVIKSLIDNLNPIRLLGDVDQVKKYSKALYGTFNHVKNFELYATYTLVFVTFWLQIYNPLSSIH